jgi:release factor glutamine methyltransferase
MPANRTAKPTPSPLTLPATVGGALASATAYLQQSGSATPRLDAELLLGHAVGTDRATLLAASDARLSDGQRAATTALLERRARGEPVAYIRGLKEFFGIALSVDARALIPRPETETLVELGLVWLRGALTSRPRGDSPLTAWDVGTGSGAIVVALAVECRRHGYLADLRFRATDISPEALGVAIENAVAHGVADVIEFAQLDLTGEPGGQSADLVLANLPYVPSAAVPELPVAAHFEPALALDGGPDGLDVVRRLLAQLPSALARAGAALLEIGSDQVEPLRAAVTAALPGWSLIIHDDLGGAPRVAELARVDA